jgi:hypothetical protein
MIRKFMEAKVYPVVLPGWSLKAQSNPRSFPRIASLQRDLVIATGRWGGAGWYDAFVYFCMLLCCYICLIMSLSLILDPQHQILNIEKERGRKGFSRQDIATHVYFPWFNHQTFTQRACQQDFVDGNSSTEGTASRDWPRDAGEPAF